MRASASCLECFLRVASRRQAALRQARCFGARGLKLSPQISQNRAALLTAEESEAGGGRYAAEHEAVRRANEAYEAYRVRGISRGGRRFLRVPTS